MNSYISVILFLITILSRIPFRSQFLYHWDSVNFANGLQQFDVLQEHPQPPGYIVYVWLCRLMNYFIGEENASMVWISVVASGLAVVAIYHIGTTLWNRSVGLISAVTLASSPLFWFYGEIALPHTVDAFFVIVVLWLLYRVQQGEDQLLWPVVVILGIASGIRQWTLIFLLPVSLYAAWRVGLKKLAIAAVLGAFICLLWLIPLLNSCGGVGPYLEKLTTYSTRFARDTSIFMGAGWSGVAYNTRKLVLYTSYGLGMIGIPLCLSIFKRLLQREWPKDWGRIGFLGLWIVPALIFYSLIHMGQQGLVFLFLPALILLASSGFSYLVVNRKVLIILVTLAIVTNSAVYIFMPEYPIGVGKQRLLTRKTIINSDHYYYDRFTAIQGNFSPERTSILAANWDHVRYYLPEYKVFPFDINRAQVIGTSNRDVDSLAIKHNSLSEFESESEVDAQIFLIIFDPSLETYNRSPEKVRNISLPNSSSLSYFAIDIYERFFINDNSFGLITDVGG